MSFWGSEKKTYKTTTTAVEEIKEQPVGVEGDVGVLVSPEGQLVSGGTAIQAAPYSKVTQKISTRGVPGEEVRAMMDTLLADAAAERESWTGLGESMLAGAQAERASYVGLGESLASGIQAQSAQLGGIVKATKAPAASALTALAPLALLALVFLLLR